MKLLRETIRRIMLQEGMVTADQLPSDAVILIQEFGGKRAKIKYGSFDEEQQQFLQRMSITQGDLCWGTMIIEKSSWSNKIPVWEVVDVEAGQGYGPLLYDLAMEYATTNGSGLMSDTAHDRSDDAVDVWDYYLQNRVGKDVKAYQMGDHSTSKLYTKDPTTLEALGDKVVYV